MLCIGHALLSLFKCLGPGVFDESKLLHLTLAASLSHPDPTASTDLGQGVEWPSHNV